MGETSLQTDRTASATSARTERLPVASLSVLALLGFLLISTETMPAGVLPEIAAGLSATEATVGQFVTAYALGTVVVTVPAIALTRGWRRKPLLLWGLAAFLVANTVTAVSSDVILSLVARFISGGLSGALWGMLAGYAVRISPARLAGRALSLVAVGAPVGIAFGTPLGTWLGTTFDWRWSFGGLSILALVVLGLALIIVPDAPGQGAAARTPLTRVLGTPGIAVVLVVIAAWMLGNSTTYTYIAPYLAAGGSALPIQLLLLVFGIASMAGIALTAALVDRHPRALLFSSLAGFTLAGMALAALPGEPAAVMLAVIVWGVTFGGASPQLQRPLSSLAGADADVANSFLPVAFNIAIVVAGVLGAGLLTGFGALAVPLTMAAFGTAALLVALRFRGTVYPVSPAPRHARRLN